MHKTTGPRSPSLLPSCGNRRCDTLSLSSSLFFTKEHSHECSSTAEGQRYDSHPPV
jgi:hypothetical protein